MRRRRQEEHENHERWLVSYADFITLLFAFFVVMYSISSVNEGKYKVLSDTLEGAFNQPPRAIDPIQVGQEKPRGVGTQDNSGTQAGQQADGRDALQDITQAMQQAFGELIQSGELEVRGNELWVEIELSSGLLFPSGDALPLDAAFGLVDRIADILAPYENPVHVEGFTDNVPMRSGNYPTNWELSAARAASVVRMLSNGGVNPDRLAAVGYGEFRPVADNTTAAGRKANRRVVLLVSRFLDKRHEPYGGEPGSVNAMREARSDVAAPVNTVNSSGTGSASNSTP
ncbi:flagellar motor protein MotD [Pseudomonas neustonica]|jgi:chemotaxis protein MotB|uniref:Flagellar motor protein MotD n=1 Tax=Pseudomonas neustonica TaxID=2487346 RepID=A0ABX9XNA4_9PSED|nr:flagellar motor protein MotD [Pseudomonas sp. SSM44]ROZ88501.1 flagellar motor protein MotD [Pseudomonas neustonica]|tara:strand:- start:14820 stop:15677 length:858 start_codon:yes stop_codon:yes gene_type:complete